MSEFPDLLQQIRSGDNGALNRLLALWRPYIHRNAHGRLGPSIAPREDTSDVVQNALFQIAENVEGFRGNSEAEWAVWLRTLLAGHAGKIHRFHHCQKRDVSREVAGFDETSATNVSMDYPRQESDTDRLRLAIESLPQAMKAVVCMRVFERQPFEMIAKRMQISPGNVRVLLTRATRKLKEALDPPQME